jgi:multimeric flavodoxin WrbA
MESVPKRVTAFVATARKKSTYNAVRQFLDNLKSLGNIEHEIVVLNHLQLGICKGCKRCFSKGEEFCPLKDDRDVLIEKMMASDGVIFASPNYSLDVSATMKMFLDRLGFVFHRPRFFGKTFTNIISQGIYGGDRIVKYLDFVGGGLGFNTVKGCCQFFLSLFSVCTSRGIPSNRARHCCCRRISENSRSQRHRVELLDGSAGASGRGASETDTFAALVR